MKKWIALWAMVLVLGIFGASSLVMGANTATQTVTLEVQAIDEISVSGNPGPLVVSTATAGSQPDQVTDTSTTYSITTNGTNKKITGAIDTAVPAGVTLQVNLAAPTGATSLNDVTLSITAADLVTGISQVAESALTVTYKLSATVTAGVIVSTSKTVTFTIADAV